MATRCFLCEQNTESSSRGPARYFNEAEIFI